MSTVNYLRVQLKQAERRLAKWKAKRAEIIAHMEGPNGGGWARQLLAFDANPRYIGAVAAVNNLNAILAKEETRLYVDPEARL